MPALRTTASLFRWVLRVAWVALPLAAGDALADALGAASAPVRVVASVGLWSAWAAGVLATLVARPLSLTVLRTLAPAALVATGAAALGGHTSAAALVATAVVTALASAPETAVLLVNGAAYANERRFPLRPPGPLLLGPVPLGWAVAVAGLTAGPLFLAARQWVVGGLAIVLGLPVAAVLLRSLHGLSRRWVVFVPAGLVLHDPLALVDPVLFRRQDVDSLHLAPAATDALDLTQHALGIAVELRLRQPAELLLRRPGQVGGETTRTPALLFTPSRPGAVLAEAARRRVPGA
jgi:hypothetical protein